MATAPSDHPDSFVALFDQHYPTLHRYLRRRVGLALADDLAAQVFAEALRSRHRYDPARPGAGRPWLYGIAHNLLRAHRRTEERQLRAFARSGVDALVADHADETVARVDAAALGPALAAALAELRPGDRDVLLLTAWAGFGYAETAAALGIPEGTVGSRLNRAKRQVRAAFDRRMPGRRPGDDLEVADGHA